MYVQKQVSLTNDLFWNFLEFVEMDFLMEAYFLCMSVLF